MPALRAGKSARVLTVSSIAQRGKGFDVEDPDFEMGAAGAARSRDR
ncbi:hypothetical protein AB0L64_06360 [Kribbella sp. NPDC051936]